MTPSEKGKFLAATCPDCNSTRNGWHQHELSRHYNCECGCEWMVSGKEFAHPRISKMENKGGYCGFVGPQMRYEDE